MDRTLEEVHSMGKKVERGIRQVENVVEPEKRASLVDNKRRAVRRCVKKFGERVRWFFLQIHLEITVLVDSYAKFPGCCRDMVLFGKEIQPELQQNLRMVNPFVQLLVFEGPVHYAATALALGQSLKRE
ncbi:hypothetical protein V6N13_017298 [Hibiscus sabdariffa]